MIERLVIALLLVSSVAWVTLAYRRSSARRTLPHRVDPAELGLRGAGIAAAIFTSPFCLPCQQWVAALEQVGVEPLRLGVEDHAALARRLGIEQTPVVLAVDARSGRVAAAYDGDPTRQAVARVAALTAAA